jgi:tartrate-resistant acid phosphatase type 5
MGKTAERHQSSYVLSLGDHFYYWGVGSATSRRWHRTFERVYSHSALKAPNYWRAVAGNHDHLGNISAQIAYGSLSSRWHFPSLQYAWREELHDEEGTTVDFVMIDTVLLCGQVRACTAAHPDPATQLQQQGPPRLWSLPPPARSANRPHPSHSSSLT